MKVLITGGLGYLGGRLTEYLLSENHSLTVLTRKIDLDRKLDSRVKLVSVSWNNLDKITSDFEGIDCVIHAASMNAADCLASPQSAKNFNANKTEDLLKLSINSGVKKFIYISTAHVYSRTLYGYITEETETNNDHPYAKTKKEAEDYVLNYNKKHQMNGIVVRLSNAIGPPTDINVNCWSLVVNNIARQLVATSVAELNSSGEQRRDFVTMTDACRAILHLLNAESLKYNIYNVGGEWSPKINEIINLLKERYEFIFKIEPKIFFKDANKVKDKNLEYSIQRLKSTGFKLSSKNIVINEIDKLLYFLRRDYER